MTIEEAKQALREGKKITHRYFSSDEWVEMRNGYIKSEDGVTHHEFWSLRTAEGWQTDWEIFIEPEQKKFVDDFIEHFSKIPASMPMPIIVEEKGSKFIPQRGGSNQSWKNKGKGRRF
jgi:hypothetical protein